MKNDRIYGLLKSDFESIISIFRTNKNIDKAILFGSRAKGNFKQSSDIDISIIGSNLYLNDILSANIELDNLSLPYKINLVIYNNIRKKID